jgi:uncharacterized protein YndB with AHSA1/START domain
MRVAATASIQAPPEAVFDALADARNEPQWNSRVSSAELRSGEPIGPGSHFEIVNGGTAYGVTITTYERPTRLVLEGVGKPDVTITYGFRPNDDGTEMTSDFDFRPEGITKLVFALLAPLIRRDVDKQYASFRSFCER